MAELSTEQVRIMRWLGRVGQVRWDEVGQYAHGDDFGVLVDAGMIDREYDPFVCANYAGLTDIGKKYVSNYVEKPNARD